jgi:hypothetical protein
MSETLTMFAFLATVEEHGIDARGILRAEGFRPNVIYTKAEKAARRGYTDFGVAPDLPWLTDKGRDFLSRT